MTTPTPARPCSSPARPNPGDDHPEMCSSLVPTPLGTSTSTSSDDHHQPNLRSSQPKGTSNTPGTTWLTTPRCAPAWRAAINLLANRGWHQTSNLLDTMQATGISRRTAQNHLASAAARGWIRRSHGRTRLRDLHCIENALAAVDPMEPSRSGRPHG